MREYLDIRNLLEIPEPPEPLISPILDRLNIQPIVFLDIGGYLFPDNPRSHTPPNTDVLHLTKKHCKMWGSENCYIAANTFERKNRVKDLFLLQKYNVYNRTGLIPENFIECNGPEEKGPHLAAKMTVVRNKGHHPLPIICDNRLFVALCCLKDVFCFIFEEKDGDDLSVQRWMNEPHSNLYRIKHTWEISYLSMIIHLNFIQDIAHKSGESISDLQPLYLQEVKRVRTIFHTRKMDLPQHLWNL